MGPGVGWAGVVKLVGRQGVRRLGVQSGGWLGGQWLVEQHCSRAGAKREPIGIYNKKEEERNPPNPKFGNMFCIIWHLVGSRGVKMPPQRGDNLPTFLDKCDLLTCCAQLLSYDSYGCACIYVYVTYGVCLLG